jgi:hypothetical protein
MNTEYILSVRTIEKHAHRVAREVRYASRPCVTKQRRLKAKYSSSESRILIMRDRGFRTVMLDSEAPGDRGRGSHSQSLPNDNSRRRRCLD